MKVLRIIFGPRRLKHREDGPRQECTNPGRHVAVVTAFIRWCLIFVGPLYVTCFIHHSDAYNFELAPRFLGNFCARVLILSNQ